MCINIELIGQYSYYPDFGYNCCDNQEIYFNTELKNSSFFGGNYKPERTNYYPGTSNSSVFRVMLVFVQFVNDTIDVNNWNWDTTGPPVYMNNLLSETRSTYSGSDWWNAYDSSTQRLSDYWMEISRGNMHMVGKGFYIKLSHPWWWYKFYYGTNGIKYINTEIYDSLDAKPNLLWTDYDNWTYKDGTFKYEKDRKIDMMYVVHRGWRPDIGLNAGSIAKLFASTQGDTNVVSSGDTILTGCWTFGSGCTFTPGAGFPQGLPPVIYGPYGSDKFLGLSCHETGHYHFGGGHSSYGIMSGGVGLDCRHSPWETVKLGYIIPTEVNYSNPNYELGDFSSREENSNGEVLQVPVSSNNDFFLLALRNKVSSYNRIMHGDTAHDNPFRDINPEYGKGLYIYHIYGGYNWTPIIDQECADGLFYWRQNGTFIPDWVNPNNPTQVVPFYVKDSVSYNNDVSAVNPTGTLNVDEKSIVAWGGIGKLHLTIGGDGTDRFLTNDTARWTSRALGGDRWDGWRIDYNEIFSPYSSPSTNNWGNQISGIFIYFKSESGNIAELKIEKASEYGGNKPIDQILRETPPSRPMGLKVDSCVYVNNYARPYITWLHNKEPDMLRSDGESSYKRYKLYRSTSLNYNTAPSETNYSFITNVDIPVNVTPYYIDTSLISVCYMPDEAPCPPWCWIPYFIRYRVQAVDYYDSVSVKSDFASTLGIRLEYGQYGGQEGDNPGGNTKPSGIIPKSFDLKQNYPNPFNPITNIKFDLPKDIFVTIKIYDILGREVKTLVNEFKNAGSYIVSFNGSEFASGVYFYRIQAGSFVSVKRMVLIK